MIAEDILCKDAWIRKLEAQLICPEQLLQYLLKKQFRFTWHPLGFAMCKLIDDGISSLRVHVWPNHVQFQQTPAWLVHNHLFHLKSWVLAGEIENHEYLVDGSKEEHAVYETRYKQGKSILHKSQNTCSKKIISNESFLAGQTYEVATGVFHKSEIKSAGVAVTVCETTEMVNTTPLVLGDLNGSPIYSFTRKVCSSPDLIKLIKGLA